MKEQIFTFLRKNCKWLYAFVAVALIGFITTNIIFASSGFLVGMFITKVIDTVS